MGGTVKQAINSERMNVAIRESKAAMSLTFTVEGFPLAAEVSISHAGSRSESAGPRKRNNNKGEPGKFVSIFRALHKLEPIFLFRRGGVHPIQREKTLLRSSSDGEDQEIRQARHTTHDSRHPSRCHNERVRRTGRSHSAAANGRFELRRSHRRTFLSASLDSSTPFLSPPFRQRVSHVVREGERAFGPVLPFIVFCLRFFFVCSAVLISPSLDSWSKFDGEVRFVGGAH